MLLLAALASACSRDEAELECPPPERRTAGTYFDGETMIIIEVNYELQYTPPESSPCGPSYYSTDIVYSDDPHVQVTLEEGRTAGGEWEVWGVIDAYVDCWGLVGTLEREGVETVDLELPRIDTYCNESR